MKQEDRIKNKVIYFVALFGICSGLFLMSYFAFIRTIDVDMTKKIDVEYTGEQGRATVEATCAMTDLNQRLQSFYDSIEYEIEPNENLKNGDVIVVRATYDEDLAQEYHYNPIHLEKEFVVEGLNNRYENFAQIPSEYVTKIQKEMDAFLARKKREIFRTEFSMPQAKPSLSNSKLVYTAFLNSKNSEKTDRMVNIYHLEYEYESQSYELYYLICVPEINDSQEVQEQDVFGQKAYLTELNEGIEPYDTYVKRLFGKNYEVETVNVNEAE